MEANMPPLEKYYNSTIKWVVGDTSPQQGNIINRKNKLVSFSNMHARYPRPFPSRERCQAIMLELYKQQADCSYERCFTQSQKLVLLAPSTPEIMSSSCRSYTVTSTLREFSASPGVSELPNFALSPTIRGRVFDA